MIALLWFVLAGYLAVTLLVTWRGGPCGCGRHRGLWLPRHHSTTGWLAVTVVTHIIMAVVLFGLGVWPAGAAYALYTGRWVYALYLHEKDKPRRGLSRMLGWVVSDVHGRLRIAPA